MYRIARHGERPIRAEVILHSHRTPVEQVTLLEVSIMTGMEEVLSRRAHRSGMHQHVTLSRHRRRDVEMAMEVARMQREVPWGLQTRLEVWQRHQITHGSLSPLPPQTSASRYFIAARGLGPRPQQVGDHGLVHGRLVTKRLVRLSRRRVGLGAAMAVATARAH